MENYKIKIFPRAKQDMEEVIDYLNTLSPDVALKYYTFWHVFRRDALDHTRPQNKGKKRRRKDMSKKILAMLMAVAMAFSRPAR